MAKATWNGATLAESDDIVMLEGNVYFPRDAVNREFVRESLTETVCPWKGLANYYDVVVDGAVNDDAAWYYGAPSEKAIEIMGRVAFWHGVEVSL